MRIVDFIMTFILIAMLGVSAYLFLTYFDSSSSPTEFEEYSANVQVDEGHYQFYPNMRFIHPDISYNIDISCESEKEETLTRAFSILSERTVLQFYRSDEPEIEILCSNIAPEPEEKNHFIAGEGGPSEIINTTKYSAILSGKIALYRDEKCDSPNIATHEILHVLGFDHNKNPKSIMYPITDCKQELDQYIVDEINRLYSEDALPDLAIEKVVANKSGSYLNFNILIANYGLSSSRNAKLAVYADNSKVKEYTLGFIDLGVKKSIIVENLRVSKNTAKLSFFIETDEEELEKNNNVANSQIT